MIECLIYVAIWVCIALIVLYIAAAILQLAGLPIPPKVVQLVRIVVGLFALLMLLRCVWPVFGHHPFVLP